MEPLIHMNDLAKQESMGRHVIVKSFKHLCSYQFNYKIAHVLHVYKNICIVSV